MKEIVVYEGPRVEQIQSPIPKAGLGQLVIKVEVSGTNPKDWKTWWVQDLPINMGDDFAGTVYEVGADITEFAVSAACPSSSSCFTFVLPSSLAVAYRKNH